MNVFLSALSVFRGRARWHRCVVHLVVAQRETADRQPEDLNLTEGWIEFTKMISHTMPEFLRLVKLPPMLQFVVVILVSL